MEEPDPQLHHAAPPRPGNTGLRDQDTDSGIFPLAQSWVPSGDLLVDFTLTFSAPEMVYDVCNRNLTQSARTITIATTGVPVTPGETANGPTMAITGASSGMSEADSCRGLDGYDRCPTAPPGSSSEKAMLSLPTAMASALCLMYSFIVS
uniref:Uncharacterized protein n=1 Tax=Branchiostoma floridae TaxID=7739 RepID=C3YSY2_BRAFL|eukprot:XP_002600634.1 hypothetical protein BRAFLDRAFT_95148 [Branchiostoma floridae]